jgi:hypothetical protein
MPAFIETILRLKALYPNAGLYGTAYELNLSKFKKQIVYNRVEGERLLSSYFGALVKFGSVIFNSSSFAAPRDVLIGVGGYPLGVKWSEDGTLWGKIALKYPVAYSPEVCSIYHQHTVNNSAEITEYLENQFLRYLSTIPRNELLKLDYIDDLMEYSDLCRFAAISRNIFSGHGTRARSELQFVKSPRYTKKKYKMHVLSYIPQQILRAWCAYMLIILIYIKSKIIHK